MLSRAFVVVAATLALVGWSAPMARAAGGDCHYEQVCDSNGNCTFTEICTGGSPGSPGDPGDGGSGPAVCMHHEDPVPCSVKYAGQAFWYSGGCYYHRVDPWPKGVFDDRKPDGAVYMYFCLPGAPGGWEYTWLANDPPGYGAPGVNPRDLADEAVAAMHLRPIHIGIVPEAGLDSIGIVGMPTWMWVSNPADNTFGPISRTVSAGGVTVTATATVAKVEWAMGDGSPPVSCSGRGTPYADRYGNRPSPTCGHRYVQPSWDEPGHAYTVTASSFWIVRWVGGGQRGTMTLAPLRDSVEVRIGEAQVLTQ